MQSIILTYMQEKTRLVLEMKESPDQAVRAANVQTRTGRRWEAQAEVNKAISRLQQKETIGRGQAGRAGLGYGEAPTRRGNQRGEEGKRC